MITDLGGRENRLSYMSDEEQYSEAKVVLLGNNSIRWTKNSHINLSDVGVSPGVCHQDAALYKSCDEDDRLVFKEALENPRRDTEPSMPCSVPSRVDRKLTCYDIFFKLRKFNISNTSHVNVCLDQRGCQPITQTRSVACLRRNTWRVRVWKLSSLRLILFHPERDKTVFAKFAITGLSIGKSHDLIKGNDITATVQIETKEVDESDSNIRIGSVIIKLEDGYYFPFENDDEIGPVEICFICGGQKSSSTNSPGTSRPSWQEFFQFNIFDRSERSVTVCVIRTDHRTGKQEELSNVSVDFTNQTEGIAQRYRVRLNRDDYNPMYINITICYTFQRQVQWEQQYSCANKSPLEEYLRSEGISWHGRVKVELFHWNPVRKSSSKEGLFFTVVSCGSHFAVTKSSARNTQEPCNTVIFPLNNPRDTITISVYEDSLFEVGLVGRICLPPSTLPVAVSYPAILPGHHPKVDIRFKTTVDINPFRYVLRCFQTTFRKEFHINEPIEEAYGRSLFKSLVDRKNFLFLALSWKERLLTFSFLLLIFVAAMFGRLWHGPLIALTHVLFNLFRIKLSDGKSTSISKNPIVLPLARESRSSSIDRDCLQCIKCQCSQFETCLKDDKQNFNSQDLHLSYLRLLRGIREVGEYWVAVTKWIFPLQSAFVIIMLCMATLLAFFLTLSQMLLIVILYAFIRPLLENRDILIASSNFISNTVSEQKLEEMASSIPFSRKLRIVL